MKTEQEFIVEGGHPDDPMRITGDLNRRDPRPWDGEKTEAARGRVEATDLTGAHLGEPDHPLRIDGHTIGKECLYTPFSREGIVPHETSVRVEPPQGVGVEVGEAERAVCIQYQVVWGAWNRQRLARVTGIGDCEPGQRVELKATRCGEVVADVVGVLFSKPDRIVRRDLHPHHAVASVWRRPLPPRAGARDQDGEEVPGPFPQPDPALAGDHTRDG